MKCLYIGNKELKQSWFADDMMVHIGIPHFILRHRYCMCFLFSFLQMEHDGTKQPKQF